MSRTKMGDVINLAEKFSLFSDQWSPKIIAELGDMHVKLGKIEGEFVWHKHDEEDELFFVVAGKMTLRYRDRDVVLAPGEMVVVPRGVEHMPVCTEETQIMMIEPKSTLNTGDAGGDRTVDPDWV